LGIADLGPVQWAVLGWLVVFVWVDMACPGKSKFEAIRGLRIDF